MDIINLAIQLVILKKELEKNTKDNDFITAMCSSYMIFFIQASANASKK